MKKRFFFDIIYLVVRVITRKEREKMKKKKVFKKWVSMLLYSINTTLILLDIMLLAELNEYYLFYSITINIIVLNTYLIHNFSSKTFNSEYMYIFKD